MWAVLSSARYRSINQCAMEGCTCSTVFKMVCLVGQTGGTAAHEITAGLFVLKRALGPARKDLTFVLASHHGLMVRGCYTNENIQWSISRGILETSIGRHMIQIIVAPRCQNTEAIYFRHIRQQTNLRSPQIEMVHMCTIHRHLPAHRSIVHTMAMQQPPAPAFKASDMGACSCQ
jgi:hypothetical protein